MWSTNILPFEPKTLGQVLKAILHNSRHANCAKCFKWCTI